MRQTRGPGGARAVGRWVLGPVAAALALGAAVPGQGAVKLTPGQEFLYAGTAEWKLSGAGRPTQTITGPVQITAAVTEADPAKGYSAILMRRFDPAKKADQPGMPAEASVTTVRYGADLAATPGRPTLFGSSPISEMLHRFAAPLSPQVELKAGQEWRRNETVPVMPPKPVEIVYTAVGETKVGDRAALKIEKKLAQALPYKQEVGGGTLELTEYGQTISVDPATGQVLGDEIHGKARFSGGPQQVIAEFSASATLKDTRQLSGSDLSARVKQAAAVDQVHQTLSGLTPDADRKQVLAEAAKQITAFRKDHPSSPYVVALDPVDELLGQMRAQVEREARLEGLKGKPAPAFTLKNLAGKDQSLAAYRGKIIVLNFFASWCGPCHAEAPHLEKEFWQKFRNRGVVVVGVNTGEQGQQTQKAQQFQKQHSLTYPILIDAGDKTAGQYGVMAFPTNVVIDQKGIVRSVEAGFNPKGLEQTINNLLGGKAG